MAEIAPVGAFSARTTLSGPRGAVPLSEVVGALRFMGPGKAQELRRDIDEALETEAVDPFESRAAGADEPGGGVEEPQQEQDQQLRRTRGSRRGREQPGRVGS